MSATAILAASGRRLNIESPLITWPMPTPNAPPTRSSPCHTSMLCAQPSACSATMLCSSVSVSQRVWRPARHRSATVANEVSAVVRRSPRRSCFLTLRPRWTWPTAITGLGSGDHQATQYGSWPAFPTRLTRPAAT
jgi:hypothetical protein